MSGAIGRSVTKSLTRGLTRDTGPQIRDQNNNNGTSYDLSADSPINVASVPQRSPFRYPGGKTWLIPYVRRWLGSLDSHPRLLVEPFAGGAIVGLTAAFERLVDHVVLVEKDVDVASVWKVILQGNASWLAREIEGFELTRDNANAVLEKPPRGNRSRAFATILRNRVQRGGIMAAGAGLIKNGENGKGLLSRWYPKTLSTRIRSIATVRDKITFIEGDGIEAIRKYSKDQGVTFFVDPPYTLAARRLYSNWEVDHRCLFELLSRVRGNVLLTYDNTQEIRGLAAEFGFETEPVAMKNTHHARMTELLVGKDLLWLKGARASAESKPRTAQAKLEFHL